MIIEGGVGEFVIDGWDGLGCVEAESGGGLWVLTTQAQEQEQKQEQKQARAREQRWQPRGGVQWKGMRWGAKSGR